MADDHGEMQAPLQILAGDDGKGWEVAIAAVSINILSVWSK